MFADRIERSAEFIAYAGACKLDPRGVIEIFCHDLLEDRASKSLLCGNRNGGPAAFLPMEGKLAQAVGLDDGPAYVDAAGSC